MAADTQEHDGAGHGLRVLVVADNLLVRTGLATLLTTRTDLRVVGQVAGSDNLADDVDVYRPQVVLYDLGYEPATALTRLDSLTDLPLVVLLADVDDAGAAVGVFGGDEPDGQPGYGSGYGLLLRDSPPETLAAALNAVYYGLVTLDPALAAALVTADAATPEELPEALTPRESEVLQLLAEGLPNKLIARRLNISPNTVKFHINAILSKLGVQSRTEAVIRATRAGLVFL